MHTAYGTNFMNSPHNHDNSCLITECPEDMVKCKSGKCISHTWICDGENDCPDNDDEEDCTGD